METSPNSPKYLRTAGGELVAGERVERKGPQKEDQRGEQKGGERGQEIMDRRRRDDLRDGSGGR